MTDDKATIERYDLYEATVRMRRGGRYVVKPEAECMEGERLKVRAAWPIGGDEKLDDDGKPLYPGEYAMTIEGERRWPISWVASGDLVDLKLVDRLEGP